MSRSNGSSIPLLRQCALAALACVMMSSTSHAITARFQQIDWGDGLGGYNALNSDWGRFELGLGPADTGLLTPDGFGGFFGYLNVVTNTSAFGGSANNWAVQNVPIAFNSISEMSGRLDEGYNFDLTTSSGIDVPSLQFQAYINSVPVAAPGGAPILAGPAILPSVNYLYGGMADVTIPTAGGTDQAAPAKAANTKGAAVGQMIQSSTKIGIAEANVPSIDEELEGCAPGSAARSIHYLKQKFPNLAAALVTETPQQTYTKLKAAMMTQVGKNAAGTQVPKFKTGKDTYNDALPGKPIMTTQTGGAPADFTTAMMALGNMKDVEAMIYWGTNAAGKSQGGHAAFISEIIKIKDAATGAITGFQLNIIDDRPQGDGMANNTKTTLTFDAAGNLQGYGAGAKMIGFQIEMVMVPEPTGVLLVAMGLLALGGRARKQRTLAAV